MENWREHLKDKPVKYWIRTEIEEIIKEKSVDRKRFYEYSKTKYQKIINEFYYAFADHKKYPKVELNYCWLHFRQELKKIDCISETIGWECMLAKIKERLSYDWNKKVYLILSDGWVYEGYIDNIIDVLEEVDGLLEDFYIVTPQFDKFAAYSDDGQCLVFYEK
ncbi:hypothetical protein E5329_13970 [Petralouisia muris]|uniref:Uncharacterized protein n=2 Tax=Petralouisia muris TaxID=3032872 RepID=A0AC61RVC6_9FIRM|nr:hypothetical protein E5329_13970 [Petralouisia muris]